MNKAFLVDKMYLLDKTKMYFVIIISLISVPYMYQKVIQPFFFFFFNPIAYFLNEGNVVPK